MKSINWLNDYYGSEEKNKRYLVAGAIFGILAALMLLPLYLGNVDLMKKILNIYLLSMFSACAFLMFSSYFYTKKANRDKFKAVKYCIFILSLMFFAIAFLPIVLVGFLSEKTKFNCFFKYGYIYAITVCIPFLVAFAGGMYVLTRRELWEVAWLNIITLTMLIMFFLWRIGSILLLKAFGTIGKKRLSEADYLAIKKDLYIIVFTMITGFTIIANCIVFKGIEKELLDGITNSFAIYIAIDRLLGKWKDKNDDYEGTLKRLNEENNKIVEEEDTDRIS